MPTGGRRRFPRTDVDLPLVLLAAYWLMAGSSLVLGPLIIGRFVWITWVEVELMGGIIATSGAVGVTTWFVRQYRSRELIGVLPGLMALVGGVIPLWLFFPKFILLRTLFCASFSALTVATFASVLYSENVGDHTQVELMHRRYLEYLRNYLWVVAFITVGYLSWEIQAESGAAGVLPPPMEDMPVQTLWVAGFMQLAFTVGIGVILVIYAFHTKLGEIEAHAARLQGGEARTKESA